MWPFNNWAKGRGAPDPNRPKPNPFKSAPPETTETQNIRGHFGPDMPKVKPPKKKSDHERIADALERIADELEAQSRARLTNTGPR